MTVNRPPPGVREPVVVTGAPFGSFLTDATSNDGNGAAGSMGAGGGGTTGPAAGRAVAPATAGGGGGGGGACPMRARPASRQNTPTAPTGASRVNARRVIGSGDQKEHASRAC